MVGTATIDGSVIGEAVALAAEIHGEQTEKDGGAPYLGHLLRVCSTVVRNGGTTDQAVAALLHDAVEDSGPHRWPDVHRFGNLVTQIVAACSDAQPEGDDKPPWLRRKQAHITHLRHGELDVVDGFVVGGTPVPAAAYLVIAADKLDALERTVDAVAADAGFWRRGVFKGGRLGTVWYYRCMAEIVAERLAGQPIAGSLERRADELAELCGVAGASTDALLAAAIERDFPDGILDGQR